MQATGTAASDMAAASAAAVPVESSSEPEEDGDVSKAASQETVQDKWDDASTLVAAAEAGVPSAVAAAEKRDAATILTELGTERKGKAAKGQAEHVKAEPSNDEEEERRERRRKRRESLVREDIYRRRSHFRLALASGLFHRT